MKKLISKIKEFSGFVESKRCDFPVLMVLFCGLVLIIAFGVYLIIETNKHQIVLSSIWLLIGFMFGLFLSINCKEKLYVAEKENLDLKTKNKFLQKFVADYELNNTILSKKIDKINNKLNQDILQTQKVTNETKLIEV